jgi:hypothetical protein
MHGAGIRPAKGDRGGDPDTFDHPQRWLHACIDWEASAARCAILRLWSTQITSR